MDFSKLIEHIQTNYYSELLMFFAELVALIIGFLYIKNDKLGRFFIAYILFDFCIVLAGWYLEIDTSISQNFKYYFQNATNTLVAYVELLVYFYFFGKILKGEGIKKVLKGFAVLYSLLLIIFITTKFDFITARYGYIADLIGAIEFVFLLVPCICYFLQLFKINTPLLLTERPSFWVVTGIFLYSLISIPSFLLHWYFVNTRYEFRHLIFAVLYFFPFTANFIFLIKAFLCKKTLTI